MRGLRRWGHVSHAERLLYEGAIAGRGSRQIPQRSGVTVELALLISSDGIALAHRQTAGHWAILKDVSFTAPSLEKAMKGLKKEAVARAGSNFSCLLILPDDQILYTSLTVPTDDPELTAYRIEEGLEGMTPYAVSELVYDWRTVETDRVKLAAVARETLDEARTFAEGHGFKTAGFAAMPPLERFPGVPLFELAKSAADVSFPDDGIAFGPDTFGEEPEETGDAEEVAADAPPTGPEADAAPSDPTGDAAKAAAPEPEPEPQPEPETEPEPDPDPQADALADAADRDPEEIIAAAAEAPAQPDPEPPIAEPEAPVLEDPALTEPVAPIGDADGDDAAPAAPGTDTNQPPEFSARGTRVPARDIDAPPDEAETGEPEPGPAADAPSEDGAQAAQNPLAQRLSRVREASKARGPKTAKPVVPPSREGAAAVPPQRKGRLSGLSATPFPGTDETAAPDSASRKGLGGRIGGMLGRGTSAEAAPAEPPHDEPGARSITGTGRLSALGEALRLQPQDGTLPDADAPARDGTEDANLTDGLLGRKPEEPTGKSFRTGLLLTIVLLILLAAIAVWSALFLPDSPVARLFGGGSEVAAEDPLDAPDAPFAITAPPAIGELATVDAPPATLLEETEPPQVDAAPEDEAAADGIDLATPDDAVDEVAEAVVEAVAETQAETPAIPPLPPLPQDAVPSLAETEAVYAEYRIWQRPPDRPDLATLDSLSDLSLSTVDPAVTALDAISLPTPRLDPTETLRRVPPPPPFGARPDTTAAGLVVATPDGVVTPDGVLVTAGPPPVLSIPRPREQALPPRTPTFSIEDAILGTFRPAPRPGDLGAATPQDTLPGRPAITRASLSPQPRALPPEAPTASEQAAAASLFPRPDRAEEPAEISAAAVARSLVPATRPGNMETLVANAVRPARQEPAAVIEAAAVAPGPSIPSNADVARAATQRNELRLREVNLIGVTGTASDRRALVRLPSGRFVRVGVGDRLNGGRVAAIGASTLQYVRGGRTVTLDIPG
jgi:hypothetical protein